MLPSIATAAFKEFDRARGHCLSLSHQQLSYYSRKRPNNGLQVCHLTTPIRLDRMLYTNKHNT